MRHWVVVMKVKVNYRVSRFVLICAQKKLKRVK